MTCSRRVSGLCVSCSRRGAISPARRR
jgi:hypothetical protein